MATTQNYSSQVSGAVGAGQFYAIQNTVSSAVATGTVQQALYIPAGTVVCNVVVETVVASDKTHTANVGDGTTAAGWDAAINMAATAGTQTVGVTATDAYVATHADKGWDGKTYSTADTIDVTHTVTSGPATAGSYKITAICTKGPLL